MAILDNVKKLESLLDTLVDESFNKPKDDKEYKKYEEAEKLLKRIVDKNELPIILEQIKHSQQDYWG